MPEKQSPAQIIAGLSKKHDLRIASLSDAPADVPSVSCGNFAIDHLIGSGFPRGRYVEVFGPEACGKTTLAMQAAVEAQKVAMRVCYLDYEHAVDVRYARALGLNLDDTLFVQPDFLEQGIDIVKTLASQSLYDFFVFDSVAAMLPEKLHESEPGKGQIALQARVMSHSLQQLIPIFARSSSIGIFINHESEVIDTSPMGQRLSGQGVKRYTTPGGRALKFYASVRIQFTRGSQVKRPSLSALTGETVRKAHSTDATVTIVKNKVGPPFGQAKVRVQYGHGFSQPYAVLQALIASKAITLHSGGIYKIRHPELQDHFGEQPKDSAAVPYVKGEDTILAHLFSNTHALEAGLQLAKIHAQAHQTLVAEAIEVEEPEDELEETEDLDALLGVSET